MSCIFCSIVDGKIPTSLIAEGDSWIAFEDIHPKAKTHLLIVPKMHIETLNDLNDSNLAADLLLAPSQIAQQLHIALDGYKVLINCNAGGGQEIFHLHLHLLSDFSASRDAL